MGTDLPAWMMYGAIEWPFRFLMLLTVDMRINDRWSCEARTDFGEGQRITLKNFAIQLYFIGFHHFLNGGTYVTQSNINARFLGHPKTSYQGRNVGILVLLD